VDHSLDEHATAIIKYESLSMLSKEVADAADKPISSGTELLMRARDTCSKRPNLQEEHEQKRERERVNTSTTGEQDLQPKTNHKRKQEGA
jgi:hypothetical protein